MHLQHPFYKFPFRFDVERLRAEIEAIPESAWHWHHENFKGNSALHLITTNGEVNDDFRPPMLPTDSLKKCPYILQVFSQFKTLMGRARLMRLEPGDGVPAHFDSQYYWRAHSRVHIPVITHPDIRFHCGSESVHMAAGEAWTFDNWRMHKVVNQTPTRRIHLTFDTYGSNEFWELAKPFGSEGNPVPVPYRDGFKPQLEFESFGSQPVMSPGEMDLELSSLASDVTAFAGNDRTAVALFEAATRALRKEWQIIWHMKGPTAQGLPLFLKAQRQFQDDLQSLPPDLKMASNGCPLREALPGNFAAMIDVQAFAAPAAAVSAPRTRGNTEPVLDRPLFIVSAPRAGSTLLFETLAAHESLWNLGGEGLARIEDIAAVGPTHDRLESDYLTAGAAGKEVTRALHAHYLSNLRNAAGRPLRELGDNKPEAVRVLEKTSRSALHIAFLKAVFPDAKFIFLHREARANISAIMEAWRSGRFVTYPNLPGWTGLPWSLPLIPGWRDLIGGDIAKIAARQWCDTNEIIMKDLAALPAADWCAVRYEDLLSDAGTTLKRLSAFAELPFDVALRQAAANPLKPARFTLTKPDPDKWRKNEGLMAPHLDTATATAAQLARLDSGASHRVAAQ